MAHVGYNNVDICTSSIRATAFERLATMHIFLFIDPKTFFHTVAIITIGHAGSKCRHISGIGAHQCSELSATVKVEIFSTRPRVASTVRSLRRQLGVKGNRLAETAKADIGVPIACESRNRARELNSTCMQSF